MGYAGVSSSEPAERQSPLEVLSARTGSYLQNAHPEVQQCYQSDLQQVVAISDAQGKPRYYPVFTETTHPTSKVFITSDGSTYPMQYNIDEEGRSQVTVSLTGISRNGDPDPLFGSEAGQNQAVLISIEKRTYPPVDYMQKLGKHLKDSYSIQIQPVDSDATARINDILEHMPVVEQDTKSVAIVQPALPVSGEGQEIQVLRKSFSAVCQEYKQRAFADVQTMLEQEADPFYIVVLEKKVATDDGVTTTTSYCPVFRTLSRRIEVPKRKEPLPARIKHQFHPDDIKEEIDNAKQIRKGSFRRARPDRIIDNIRPRMVRKFFIADWEASLAARIIDGPLQDCRFITPDGTTFALFLYPRERRVSNSHVFFYGLRSDGPVEPLFPDSTFDLAVQESGDLVLNPAAAPRVVYDKDNYYHETRQEYKSVPLRSSDSSDTSYHMRILPLNMYDEKEMETICRSMQEELEVCKPDLSEPLDNEDRKAYEEWRKAALKTVAYTDIYARVTGYQFYLPGSSLSDPLP